MDQATLSPPEGYKDAAALTNALGGALGGHVFGAQHIQQLQVIQRLQQQRAAMLAARSNNGHQQGTNNGNSVAGGTPTQSAAVGAGGATQPYSQVCTECAECAECAAKQNQEDGKEILGGDIVNWI